MATKYKYDKDTDYAALMERAAQRGDNAAAAIYEQQRNAKIRGEGMTDVTQSNDYAQYLPLEDVPDYDDTHRRQAESLLTERDTTGQRARIDQMLDALLGEEFDYDPASDKLYAAYRQQYERQADLASANALGAGAAGSQAWRRPWRRRSRRADTTARCSRASCRSWRSSPTSATTASARRA